MAIEFRCTQCGKLLRTGDDTAGKQAKCPACGTVLTIPQAGAAAGEPFGLSPPPLTPQGPGQAVPQQPAGGDMPGFSENPFASPSSSAAFGPAPVTAQRAGPPWERDGASMTSFIETVKQLYGSTAVLFSDMRREGGIGMPIGFAIVGGMIGGVISAIFQSALQGVVGNLAVPGGANFGPAVGGSIMGIVCTVVILPFAIVLGLFINAGLIHLALMVLGGANHPFETTFRTISYSAGGSSLLSAIPLCGGLLNLVAQLVFEIIGLSKSQEISGGKAAAAVLIPFFVCCGVVALAVIAFITLGVAAAGANNFR